MNRNTVRIITIVYCTINYVVICIILCSLSPKHRSMVLHIPLGLDVPWEVWGGTGMHWRNNGLGIN